MDGVRIVDKATTFISPDAVIGKGTVILPFVVIGERVIIGEGCEIGPFTHIRPDVTLGNNVKAGAFVEIKNSNLGDGTKAAHLAYVGDCDAGKNVNFGCGTITVNHNGAQKSRTVIEDGAYIGCNTNLVAPVTIGEGAYTAAGSTITHDVPPGALAIARERQTNKEDWKRPARD
jgi:bifunctional UDP-N-acetylglucosamine pyrophosphorylase/glucosamine-1-phosphate N-acetyltransferase